MKYRRVLAAVGVVALVFATAAACPPKAGDSCDPAKELYYYSSTVKNGKRTTVSLECRQVGVNRYEWVKV